MWVLWQIILDSSAVEHSAVNRRVVGSNPTRGARQAHSKKSTRLAFLLKEFGSVVKRLRHRPFTAVTRVQFPSESFSKWIWWLSQVVRLRTATPSSPVQIRQSPLQWYSLKHWLIGVWGFFCIWNDLFLTTIRTSETKLNNTSESQDYLNPDVFGTVLICLNI